MDIIQVAGIVVVLLVVKLHHTDGALRELVKVLLAALCPLYFCKCRQTGERHIFHLTVGGHILRPYVGLYAYNESSQILRFALVIAVIEHVVRYGFVAVHAFNGQVASNGFGFRAGVEGLIIVEVEIGVRRHDDVVMLFGSFDTASLSTP